MTEPVQRVFVLGYGNPGRRDDGLGPALVARLEEARVNGLTLDADYQLNIEDGAAVAGHDYVLFVDAAKEGPEPFELRRVQPAPSIAFTSHTVSPEAVLAVCEDHFGAAPQAWTLGIRGYDFEFVEGLTPRAQANLEEAVAFVLQKVRTWKESNMDSGSQKKTVLTIDDDPDIRAALRMVLEAEGFMVGEAASGEEGAKIAQRIDPDAIIIDLMMETVDAGTVAAQKMKDDGYGGPIYLLSSAGDTVRYNLDARDLGLAGIFQKPIDPRTLVATLKAKLL